MEEGRLYYMHLYIHVLVSCPACVCFDLCLHAVRQQNSLGTRLHVAKAYS
jgi:hypothetical protein